MLDKKFSSIELYLRDRDKVPTVAFKNSLWFSITEKEKALVKECLEMIDSIPESEWRKWSDEKKLLFSTYGNNADSILRNSIVS